MRTHTAARIFTAACLSLALAASAFAASQNAVPQREQTRPAARQQATKANVKFQTERTDSWLCLYVSPFFCTNLYPALGTSSGNSSSTTATVPDRSRR